MLKTKQPLHSRDIYTARRERDLSAFFVTVHLYTNDDTVWEPWPVTAAQSATTLRRSIRFPFVQSLRVWSAFYKLKRPTRRYDLIKLLSFVDFQTQTNCTSLSTHNRHRNCSSHFGRGFEEMSWNLLVISRTMWRHVRKNNDRSITTGSVSHFQTTTAMQQWKHFSYENSKQAKWLTQKHKINRVHKLRTTRTFNGRSVDGGSDHWNG